MTKGRRTATAIIAAVGVLALAVSTLAQTGSVRTPTQTDFDLCNREAQLARGGLSGGGVSASPSTAPTTPGAGGGLASGPTGAAGATGGTGSVTGGSTLSSGGAATGDVQLRGMGASGASDAAYQQAYRDCMRRRGY
jgi:hypothetical protein